MSSPSPRIVVIGTGSVGRRHIENLSRLGATVGAFSYRGVERQAELPSVRFFNHLAEVWDFAPDAVVVANSTDRHVEVALEAAQAGCHLFIEKPLSNSLRGVQALVDVVHARNLVVETGFMLRFHPNLRWMKQCLDGQGVGTLHYAHGLFGQFLPEWRPGTDYRQCYSARRGVGGVIFDLVHEIDLIGWFLGPIRHVQALTAYVAPLGIESEAMAEINIRTANGALGHIHVDYVRPSYARTFEIVGSDGVLSWDYTRGLVSFTDRAGQASVVHQAPADFERNQMFLDYMQYFLMRLQDRTLPPASSMQNGVDVARAALAAHQSAIHGRLVEPAAVDEHFSLLEPT